MDQYRVFGNPIKQSRSPYIHQEFALQTKQAIDYKSELVSLDGFEEAVFEFIRLGGMGANVTAPFKEQAMKMCDQLTERALLAGSVNTLSFSDGKILGDTTDGDGLVNDLLANCVEISNKRILLLGAGGAAKGVIPSILKQQPKQIVIANRTVEKAKNIAMQYSISPISARTFEQVNAQPADQVFDIIINATSAGLNGQALSISPDIINTNTICYDMTYSKELTPFLKIACERNAKQLIDGLGMLVGQAAVSFEIWRKVRPETTNVLQKLREDMLR